MKIIKDTWAAKLVKLWGFNAIVLFGVCHTNIDLEKFPDLLRHETVHYGQQKRDGWKFYFKYLWWSMRFGYWNNPYEREARGEKCQTK